MPYYIRNAYPSGAQSVGTRPLHLGEAIDSTCARIGRDGAQIGAILRHLPADTPLTILRPYAAEGLTDEPRS